MGSIEEVLIDKYGITSLSRPGNSEPLSATNLKGRMCWSALQIEDDLVYIRGRPGKTAPLLDGLILFLMFPNNAEVSRYSH